MKLKSNEDEGYTELNISTTDRPGLLTDIVHTLKDVSVNVISAEACPVQVHLTQTLARSARLTGLPQAPIPSVSENITSL